VTARVVAFVVDAVLVVLFATLGRVSHAEGVTASGVASVAWPFLLALTLGWGLARARGRWPVRVPGSPVVWLVTAVVGLALRVVTGGGFAVSFGVVTLLVLGVFLIGWRCAREVAAFAMAGLQRRSAAEARRPRPASRR
jgi:Protein of unknown function (DUF3054)